MDNMKISTNQYDRVSPSQSGAKERDEGYVSSSAEANKARHEADVAKKNNNKPSGSQDVSDDHSTRLIEQRKRALAEQLSEKDKAQEQRQQNEELSAQRQIESRAAANREKIKSSYDAVKHSDNHERAEKVVAEESRTDRASKNETSPDPINLVV